MSDMLAKAPIDRRLAELLRPTVEGLGFELVRVRLIGSKTPTLQIMAERPDGRMEVEDCATLSRSLSAVLDVEDPIESEYTLEVSSPGIDRPLTRIEDFDRWKGFVARLEADAPVDGRKRFKGVLTGREGDRVGVETDAGPAMIPFADLADAKLVLTDELIAASLKGQQDKGFDPGAFDEVDYEDDGDAEARAETTGDKNR
jgi:ribosome maturation factor RimP